MVKLTGVDAVKMEGGAEIADTVKGIVEAGIPVMGHLGLTPQHINEFGGYGLRAKEEHEAHQLLSDAKALEKAGVFGITLEKIPAQLAARVTKELHAVTIGIGAGNGTDGQILVYADALGMTRGFQPKFLRHFADVRTSMKEGIQEYIKDVKDTSFPNADESY
jgi:3-methyl-2-oxobutanoate hydroxymethyltransferase